MARKTIPVLTVRDTLNAMIDASPPENVQAREALMVVAQRILLDTDNYHGYRYTRTEGTHEDGTWNVLDESYVRFC